MVGLRVCFGMPSLGTLLVLCGWIVSPTAAQPAAVYQSTQFELADTVQLDRADAAVLASLERVKALLAQRQWDEAVETLRQLSESNEDKLLPASPRRFVGVRQYCQMRLAALNGEALTLYRDRVDPLARTWYEKGVAGRDRKLLENVVEQAFASRSGDKALMALGEIALEAGEFTSARWYWERILPARGATDAEPLWPSYPDSALDPAAVRARLVLVSILEGSAQRARDELNQFNRLHGDAKGRMGGREVNYAEFLGTLLTESASWPQPKPAPNWPTFAGSPERDKTAAAKVDPGQAAWRAALASAMEERKGRAASSRLPMLSTHPIVVGDMVFVNDQRQIRAMRLATGKAVWGGDDCVIFGDQLGAAHSSLDAYEALGSPQFTMTVFGSRLYARMGDPVTQRPQEAVAGESGGYLVCLDLAAEGRLVWRLAAEEGWAFEGSPLADANNIYVAMRRQDVRPEAYVACFDAQTAQLRWRRFVCGAETPARAMLAQVTHNLLSMHEDTIYTNTNLGAVAALRASDGAIRWVALYPRALRGDVAKLEPHWRRALTPCLYHRGTLYFAPCDSSRIFAIDAASGVILWQSAAELSDVEHLLGVVDDCLIASGGKLYWIGLGDADRGRVRRMWPDGREKPGFGRGVLTSDGIAWPTRDTVALFDGKAAAPRKTIDLKSRGLGGGNLLAVGGRLLISGERELACLGPTAQAAPTTSDITQCETRVEEAAGNRRPSVQESLTHDP